MTVVKFREKRSEKKNGEISEEMKIILVENKLNYLKYLLVNDSPEREFII